MISPHISRNDTSRSSSVWCPKEAATQHQNLLKKHCACVCSEQHCTCGAGHVSTHLMSGQSIGALEWHALRALGAKCNSDKSAICDFRQFHPYPLVEYLAPNTQRSLLEERDEAEQSMLYSDFCFRHQPEFILFMLFFFLFAFVQKHANQKMFGKKTPHETFISYFTTKQMICWQKHSRKRCTLNPGVSFDLFANLLSTALTMFLPIHGPNMNFVREKYVARDGHGFFPKCDS
eukprot:c20782_g1_i2.p1 GENE.c20782_g1_i2~~c20782_g1_i2.p1  ORF type:complete len:233 (+),score=33.40 c20782_g1_i2:105-803(+)